jgi:hypothetical protein
VILIPSRDAIFVHVPRTGGTALSRALCTAIPDSIWLDGLNWKHATAAMGRALFDRPVRVLAVIRSPWDSHRSHYGWLKRWARTPEFLPAPIRARVCELATWPFEQVVWECTTWHTLARPAGFWRTYCDEETQVFRYEDSPWEAVGDCLNCRLNVIRENESIDPPPAWTSRAIDLVAELCHLDIERFGYAPPCVD